MPLPESIAHLISAVRMRLVLEAAGRRMLAALGIGAGLAAAVLGPARHVVLPWAKPLSITLVAGLMAVALGWTILRPPSRAAAALVADRALGGYDRLSDRKSVV